MRCVDMVNISSVHGWHVDRIGLLKGAARAIDLDGQISAMDRKCDARPSYDVETFWSEVVTINHLF